MTLDPALSLAVNAMMDIDNSQVFRLPKSGYVLSVFCRNVSLSKFMNLLDWAHENQVVDLTLNDCKITDGHVLEICGHPLSAQLSTLDLRDNELSVQSANAIADCGVFRNLDTLDLSETAIGNRGAVAIIDALASTLARVTRLGLSCVGMRQDGYMRLLNSPVADRLASICFCQSPIRPATRKLLEAKFGDKLCCS